MGNEPGGGMATYTGVCSGYLGRWHSPSPHPPGTSPSGVRKPNHGAGCLYHIHPPWAHQARPVHNPWLLPPFSTQNWGLSRALLFCEAFHDYFRWQQCFHPPKSCKEGKRKGEQRNGTGIVFQAQARARFLTYVMCSRQPSVQVWFLLHG